MVEHKSLAAYVGTASAEFRLSPGDRVLQFASISFDASAEEIYPCLTRGATLVLRSDAMLGSAARFLEKCRDWSLTVLDLPTSYWHELTVQLHEKKLSLPPSVRLVIIGGEKALAERLALWRERVERHVRLVNTYGPTEATIVATMYDLSGDGEIATPPGDVPIGRPISNVHAYILDEHRRPVPEGEPGELYIGGAGVTRGYLNRPDLTAERFLADPFKALPGARMYRTGDVVRALPGGDLLFLGRADRQVKVRGFRVELEEVEAVLCQHPEVREGAVVAREDAVVGTHLAAYVVLRGSAPPSDGQLRAFLGEQLPDYMLPTTFTSLEALPRLPSGKLDPTSLSVPEAGGRERAAPHPPLEISLPGGSNHGWSHRILRTIRAFVHTSRDTTSGHAPRVLIDAREGVHALSDGSERKLVLAFARRWDLSETMLFEAVYHETLRVSLKKKIELFESAECVWLYDAGTQELIGESYGVPVRDAFKPHEQEGFEDIQPYLDRKAFYVFSTTILPRFQGRGLGKILKALMLGVVSQAGFEIVLGHARSGASLQLNRAFGAEIGVAHPNWYGSGETYYFYSLRFDRSLSAAGAVKGKVDRRPPPQPEKRAVPVQASAKPCDELERQLVAIWQDILSVNAVGTRDSFFDLGGHSLLALRMLTQLEERLSVTLPLATLFQAPTIERLAALIREGTPRASRRLLVRIQPAGSRPPVFAVPGVGGNVLCYHDLARFLGPDQPFYGLQSQGLDGSEEPVTRIEDIAANFLREIREVQPDGPYSLVGTCMGGVVAYEIAQQLRAAGQEIGLLALLETWPPHPAPGQLRRVRVPAALGYIASRLRQYIEMLARLHGRERLRYLRERLKLLTGVVAQRGLFSAARRDIYLYAVTQANQLALQRYAPRPYPGAVVLFCAEGRDVTEADDLRLTWRELATGGLDVHMAPGDDSGLMLTGPNVRILATKLKEYIERAQVST